MPDPITIHVCSHFRPEVERFILDQGLASRFRVQEFPAICHGIPGPVLMSESSPDHASGQASGATSAPASSQTWGSGKDSGTLLFAGNQCPARPKATPQGSQPEGDPNNGGIISGACLSLIAPGWLLENLVREGSYLVSPGWLADWKKNVAVWGFDTTGLREFVQGSIKQVCLLDTLTLADSERRLAEFSKALGLPALRIPVGMAYCSEVLQSIISPKPAEPRPGADYAMALDLISRLGQFQDENQVISQLLEILSMLFAPGSLFLIRYEDGSPAGLYHTFSEEQVVDEATAAACSAFSRSTSPSEHEDGFVLPIDFDNQRMALVFMTSLAMPESRDSYLNLIESIVPIFSLSLNNARNYEALVRNETALQDKQKELLDTLEFRDRLLAIIGHDLRGPIGSMGDLLQVLGESLEGSIPEREKNFLSEIILAAQSASALLLNLLEWAKLQTSAVVLTPEVLLAKDEVAEIFSIMQSQAALKEITLRNEADPGFRVYADRNIMQTILRNLVSNALKYTQPGGSVTVRTHQSNGNHNMDIVDTGTGMDKETLANALDFSRRRSMAGTKGERGSGLGLVFCKELAEKSGATLAMESAPGKGTKVSLIFTQPA